MKIYRVKGAFHNEEMSFLFREKNKRIAKRKIIDWFIKINKIENKKDIAIELKEVKYINGDYKEIN